ncbi:MAG: hypothetical protein IIZ39_00855, partial [Blautia sp.]|nr:hypothetical protein [Blautia sp.]
LWKGLAGRPYEIRSYLANKRNVSGIVVLDDDVWDFGWMSPYFLLTRTPVEMSEEEKATYYWGQPSKENFMAVHGYFDGLTEELADKAIGMLAEQTERHERWRKEVRRH